MTADPVLVGADLGTSGLKVAALGPDGAVVAEVERGYDVDRPQPGWAEIDVRVWRSALEDALAELAGALAGRPVAALGLSGQMHGVVLVDGEGSPLAPALLWPDQRAAAEVDRWRALPGDERAALANPLVPGMTGPLLAWLAAHRPELVGRARAVLLPKDAVRAALLPGTDAAVTDRSDASATLLWDVPADRWSAAAADAAGVPAGLLPAVRPGDEVRGTAVLPVGEVPVVTGGADTPLALLAAGTTSGVQVNLGSGAQLLRPVGRPAPAADPVVHSYAAAAGGWYRMAALQNAGTAWSWVRAVLGLDWAGLIGALETAGPGAGGVSFLPFLSGERGGVAAPSSRGSWTGLTEGTTRAELARAAVEGVAFSLAAALELLGPLPAGEGIVVTGGGARSDAVQQLLADVTGRGVRYAHVRSASAAGAAVLAGRGVGVELVPQRALGRELQPRPVPGLRAAQERWTALAGVEPGGSGHR